MISTAAVVSTGFIVYTIAKNSDYIEEVDGEVDSVTTGWEFGMQPPEPNFNDDDGEDCTGTITFWYEKALYHYNLVAED